ncbi:sirohydrochlorin chelatase [Gordonia sp. CPCC 205515]|uniref:sirohydrochlorin chelatase n=1 Tax=Gordonia sp. CPCC 205515 TaxID=3140791 RepID=UPI003AF3447B
MTEFDRSLRMQPILVAHGTRSAHGVGTIARLAEQVSARLGPTRTAFVDVLGPSPSEVLADIDGPAVLIPAFLASGYHVRVDIPAHVDASGHSHVHLCDSLGPDPVLADVMGDRLVAAGWRPGDAVVLAAAGSSDSLALADVGVAAAQLGHLLGTSVDVGYVATAQPAIADVVSATRARTGRRVFIASYLLAPGLFHGRLETVGADGVAAPLGADPRIAELIVARYQFLTSAPCRCEDLVIGG